MFENVIESIKRHEGFSKLPYIDPLVRQNPEQYGISVDEFKIIDKHFDKLKVTFGYGFTYITETESVKVLEVRLKYIYNILAEKIKGFTELHQTAQEVLLEMAYQLGWPTLLKFKKTLKYLEDKKYSDAAVEMLDSRWARQTPSRAKELSEKLKMIV